MSLTEILFLVLETIEVVHDAKVASTANKWVWHSSAS